MLSCWWGEVGGQLTTATKREELRSALEPLKVHGNIHHISRLLLVSSTSADAKQIREAREVNGNLIKAIYDASARQRNCRESVQEAEIALGQATPGQKKAVEAELLKRKEDSLAADRNYEAASESQSRYEQELNLMEAGYAQDELLMFIDKRFIKGKYARNSRNLADAIAGLPYTHGVHFLGVWQSYARCSKLFCPSHHQTRMFETIQSVWKRFQPSAGSFTEFFHREIVALPKTVVVEALDPVTKTRVENTVENSVRSSFLERWPIWKLAIEKSLESSVEPERVPFVIFSNFKTVQTDPRTYVHMVLGGTEKKEN